MLAVLATSSLQQSACCSLLQRFLESVLLTESRKHLRLEHARDDGRAKSIFCHALPAALSASGVYVAYLYVGEKMALPKNWPDSYL